MTEALRPQTTALIRDALVGGARVRLELDIEAIACAAELMREAVLAGRKVLLCGNGGSAADAQHIAAELVGRYVLERRPLAAIALTTDTSALTAIANDYGYEHVFARQVEGLGAAGDVLVAITTSGTSKNVVAAVEAARRIGMKVIGLTGANGAAFAAHRADPGVPHHDRPPPVRGPRRGVRGAARAGLDDPARRGPADREADGARGARVLARGAARPQAHGGVDERRVRCPARRACTSGTCSRCAARRRSATR
jgi:D-sedoheptulose 7-phosphate isomerase